MKRSWNTINFFNEYYAYEQLSVYEFILFRLF